MSLKKIQEQVDLKLRDKSPEIVSMALAKLNEPEPCTQSNSDYALMNEYLSVKLPFISLQRRREKAMDRRQRKKEAREGRHKKN